MTIILNDNGHDTKLTFEGACREVFAAGYDTPLEFGYTEDETTWVSAEYAKAELLDPHEDWNTDAPFWYIRANQAGAT